VKNCEISPNQEMKSQKWDWGTSRNTQQTVKNLGTTSKRSKTQIWSR